MLYVSETEKTRSVILMSRSMLSMFFMTTHENRNFGVVDDVITDGAEQSSPNLAESARSCDNQNSFLLLGDFADDLSRLSLARPKLSRELHYINII